MSQKEKYDLAIIGAGSGGLSLASVSAQAGLKTVLFEGHKMGGDCLNYGCVPSKSLLAVAKQCWQARQTEKLGCQFNQKSLDMVAVMKTVQQKIDHIAVHDSVERFEGLGVTVISEYASFLDEHTLKAGDKAYQAKTIVIATGSSPFVPPIHGLDSVPYLTNETVFSLREKPKHMLIIGGGPIGCEMAQAFAMLGVPVSLFEADQMLRFDDRQAVGSLQDVMKEHGVSFYLQSKVEQIAQKGKAIEVTYSLNGQQHTELGSHVLVAVGRKPNIDRLNLNNAGVITERGSIQVDKRLRTAQKHIYAIGDVIGQQQFTHVANAHAGVVFRQIAFKLPAKWDSTYLPSVTYTHPELAQIGLTEQQCQAKGIACSVIQSAFVDNDRAVAEGATEGIIKVVINDKGQALGVTILGLHAGELVLPWVQLMREKRSLRSMTDAIFPYPTLNEISKRVAGQYYAPKLFSPFAKRVIRILSRF
jgi:pyruvate/2-oxoglutarate dehydrogenase complex dihydrolipoamide dehydrogenase (E3) component